MKTDTTHAELEALNKRLNDDAARAEYKKSCDGCAVSFLPRVLGNLLIILGNAVYGKEPSYRKFRAIEVIARVPYHSWTSSAYTLLTLFYMDEARALALSRTARYAGIAQENETMHVVVITAFAKEAEQTGALRHTVIPVLFAFFYFWVAYWMHLARPAWSYELNYMFESHAYEQYDRFLAVNKEALKERRAESEFLSWYGRPAENQYEFFRSVRNDELVHRNMSCEALKALGKRRALKSSAS